jgi:hypothetical protein
MRSEASLLCETSRQNETRRQEQNGNEKYPHGWFHEVPESEVVIWVMVSRNGWKTGPPRANHSLMADFGSRQNAYMP